MTYYEYCSLQSEHCEEMARRFAGDALLYRFWTGAANMFQARLETCSVEKAASPVSAERAALVMRG